jgi:hypothetical protein
MKKLVPCFLLILTLSSMVVSCSHQATQDRAVATQSKSVCIDSVRPEYHSYFDSVEKCIEKEYDK